MKKYVRISLVFSFGIIFTACGSRDLKVAIEPTFTDIQSLTLSSKCVRCHESLATYEGVKKIVTAGNPERSDLYKEVEDGEMPLQSPPLSPEEIEAIRLWIAEGAPNN